MAYQTLHRDDPLTMIAFLLFCILLCLCPPLRKLVGLLFWLLVIVVVWHWPSDERPASAPAAAPAAAIERRAPSAVVEELPVPYGSRRDVLPGVDFAPVPPPAPFVGPSKPRPYRQQ
jgi:hypothetical protein